MTDPETIPAIACTLDAGSFKERQSWIARLNAASLLWSRRDGLALQLAYKPEALQDVRRFVQGEQACCAFLDFNLDARADDVLVTITSPEAARDAAVMLFDQFEAAYAITAAQGCGCGPAPIGKAPSDHKAVGAVAATASTAALACGVCCVLPFALPAAMLGSVGGALALFAGIFDWMRPLAVLAVFAGWCWVGYKSWQSRKQPAASTVLVMAFATVMMMVAWTWPMFESSLIGLIKGSHS